MSPVFPHGIVKCIVGYQAWVRTRKNTCNQDTARELVSIALRSNGSSSRGEADPRLQARVDGRLTWIHCHQRHMIIL